MKNQLWAGLGSRARTKKNGLIMSNFFRAVFSWKMTKFADVQYCIFAEIVGGSEKVHKYADVI